MSALVVADCVVLVALFVETIVLTASKSTTTNLRRLSIALFGGSNLLSLVCLMYLCDITEQGASWIRLSIVVMGVIFLILDVALFRRLKVSEAKNDLILQNELLQQQVAGQKAQADRLKTTRAEAKSIADDLHDQLESIRDLLEQHKPDSATQGLDELAQASRSGALPLCDHAAVNSLMMFKAQVCRNEGIDLRTALLIPPSITLPAVELCSVFANITDNAIAACIDAGAEECRPTITIEAHCQGNYLLINARNTCRETSPDADRSAEGHAHEAGSLPHHGWGLSILRSIATRRDGRLVVSREPGQFLTSLALHLPPEEAPDWIEQARDAATE